MVGGELGEAAGEVASFVGGSVRGAVGEHAAVASRESSNGCLRAGCVEGSEKCGGGELEVRFGVIGCLAAVQPGRPLCKCRAGWPGR